VQHAWTRSALERESARACYLPLGDTLGLTYIEMAAATTAVSARGHEDNTVEVVRRVAVTLQGPQQKQEMRLLPSYDRSTSSYSQEIATRMQRSRGELLTLRMCVIKMCAIKGWR
jgi:hypothetical protein